MATFTAQPIEMIAAPNYYSSLPNRQWVLANNKAATLNGQLYISDSLGTRRYIIPMTATLTVTFLRADSPQIPSASQSVVKPATINSVDRSLFTLSILPADASLVISGSVIFELIDTGPGPSDKWVCNYGVLKKMTDPGF